MKMGPTVWKRTPEIDFNDQPKTIMVEIKNPLIDATLRFPYFQFKEAIVALLGLCGVSPNEVIIFKYRSD